MQACELAQVEGAVHLGRALLGRDQHGPQIQAKPACPKRWPIELAEWAMKLVGRLCRDRNRHERKPDAGGGERPDYDPPGWRA